MLPNFRSWRPILAIPKDAESANFPAAEYVKTQVVFGLRGLFRILDSPGNGICLGRPKSLSRMGRWRRTVPPASTLRTRLHSPHPHTPSWGSDLPWPRSLHQLRNTPLKGLSKCNFVFPQVSYASALPLNLPLLVRIGLIHSS